MLCKLLDTGIKNIYIIQAFSGFKHLSIAEEIAYKFYLRREKKKKTNPPKTGRANELLYFYSSLYKKD